MSSDVCVLRFLISFLLGGSARGVCSFTSGSVIFPKLDGVGEGVLSDKENEADRRSSLGSS